METAAQSEPGRVEGLTTAGRESDREFVVRRSFGAPARIVFEAWSRPELFQRWWLPEAFGMKMVACEMDVRTGGTYRLQILPPGAEQPMPFFGRYLEVVPNERIVWTNDEDGEGKGAVKTVTFEEQAGRTLVIRDVAAELPDDDGGRTFRSIGIGAIICCPLIKHGRLAAMMAVHQTGPRAWSADDVALVRAVVERSWAYIERSRADGELRQAKEAAEQGNRAKDQFLAVLSHELRTPLTPVLATVGTLELRNDLSEEIRGELQVIRRNVEMEARLIDDLLDLTRIARGKLQLNTQSTDVHQAALTAWSICRAAAEEKGLRVSIDLTASRHFVRADPARLQQILWNVLKNAIKFTPDGGTVAVRSVDDWAVDDAGDILVEVADSGCGMDAETAERVFAGFEQAGAHVARTHGGTGLGLAISRRLASLLGGSLTVASEPGVGSTFTLRIPFVPAQCPAPPDETKPVVIEAFQMTPERRQSNEDWPQWLHEAWLKDNHEPGSVFPTDYPHSDGTDMLTIQTLEGTHLVSWGDYIIQGIHGELYPCKPDIFEQTYEAAE